jgi:ribosomal protein S18 acetylase RimI-like enzyme
MSTVALRPARPEDDDFLLRVYGSTRAEELAPLGWSEAQLAAFLHMQHTMQRRSWEQQHPRAERAVVLVDGAPAGRLYVDRSGDSIVLVDIALLPEHRGAGVGERLLRDLLAESDASKRPIVLHVARESRAKKLYERLGFTPTGEDAYRCRMARVPI